VGGVDQSLHVRLAKQLHDELPNPSAPGGTMGGSVSGGGHWDRLPDSKSCSLVKAKVIVEQVEVLLLHNIEFSIVEETGLSSPMPVWRPMVQVLG
jgi:hypothetical protein